MALSKVDVVDTGRLKNMLVFMKTADELEAGLAAVRRIESLQPRPANYQRVFKELANNLETKSRGALHVLRDVDSPAVGLDNIASFETRDVIEFVENGKIKKVARFIDVIRKNPTRRLEYKAWESGKPTSWGKVGGKEGAEWEFVRDILNQKPFEWVIKGTDLDKVATKMKQTLGVLKVQRRAKVQLHPILEEALRRGRITKADIEKIIAKIDSGELLRVQGY